MRRGRCSVWTVATPTVVEGDECALADEPQERADGVGQHPEVVGIHGEADGAPPLCEAAHCNAAWQRYITVQIPRVGRNHRTKDSAV